MFNTSLGGDPYQHGLRIAGDHGADAQNLRVQLKVLPLGALLHTDIVRASMLAEVDLLVAAQPVNLTLDNRV